MKKQYITPAVSTLHIACSEMMIITSPGIGTNKDYDEEVGPQTTHEKIWDSEGSIWE